jgi:hypothetical protein
VEILLPPAVLAVLAVAVRVVQALGQQMELQVRPIQAAVEVADHVNHPLWEEQVVPV